jgi:hypothetical protein
MGNDDVSSSWEKLMMKKPKKEAERRARASNFDLLERFWAVSKMLEGAGLLCSGVSISSEESAEASLE